MTNAKSILCANNLENLIYDHVNYNSENKDGFVPFEYDYNPSTVEIERVASLLEQDGIFINTTPTVQRINGKKVRGIHIRKVQSAKCYELETITKYGELFLICSHCGEPLGPAEDYDEYKRRGKSICESCGVTINLRCETIERKRKLILPAMEEFIDLIRHDKCTPFLSPNARLLWCVLAIACHEHGAGNPVRVNQSVLEEMCGLSKDQLDAATEELINACMIYTNKQRNGYYILLLGGRE